MVRSCQAYKEERDVSEETEIVDKGDMHKCGTLLYELAEER